MYISFHVCKALKDSRFERYTSAFILFIVIVTYHENAKTYYKRSVDCVSGSPLGFVRLVNGQHYYEGRVEVYHNGMWGTVCDDGWDMEDATVVCRQLGFPYGAAKSNAQFGQGTGQIWLDDVVCSGKESRLDACSHAGWGDENCDHLEDVGIICQADLQGIFGYKMQALMNIQINDYNNYCVRESSKLHQQENVDIHVSIRNLICTFHIP